MLKKKCCEKSVVRTSLIKSGLNMNLLFAIIVFWL